jgi:hypothetical protein
MAAPNPAAALVGISVAAVIGAIAYVAFSKPAARINVVGGSRMWDNSQAPALKAKLATLKATPGPVDRTWVLGSTGTESALGRVQAIQGAGAFAVVTDNLLSGSGPMGLSQVLATEVATLAPASGNVAVLPALS